MTSLRGILISLEGGEGCGKSTQLQLLSQSLTEAGASVLIVREPGGTRIGEAVREILLDPASDGMAAQAELLLYEASRAQLVQDVVAPALDAGQVVICDRFFDSSSAYQGYGRGLGLEAVEALNSFATDGLEPDLTIVLDLDPAVGLERATKQGADRLEAEELDFHIRVRDGFRLIAQRHPERVKLVDASSGISDVAEAVRGLVHSLPGLAGLLRR